MHRSTERDWQATPNQSRLTRLNDAILRMNESSELDDVLQEALRGAVSLTGASHAVITILDQSGELRDCRWFDAAVAGMERTRDGREWTELLQSLGVISEPIRASNLLTHIESLGMGQFRLPPELRTGAPFMAAPAARLDKVIGNIFVADTRDGAEFHAEDEEALLAFARQAAMSITNAGRYLSMQQAKARLESLLDTSPVGVAVFDASTGMPASFNQEAIRIIQGLLKPGQSPQELVSAMTVRCEDGREMPLRELPFAQALDAGEQVQAEEIVLEAPDGGIVPALVSATPVHAEGGQVESFVVTMQDLTPLKELEQLRAELLAIVSHELRMPLTSIKGSVANLLDPAAALDPTEAVQFHRIIDQQVNRMRDLISDLLDVARIETGTFSVIPEPTSVGDMLDEAKITFSSSGFKNALRMNLSPDLPFVMADRRRIVQVMSNLLSNAAKFSPEASPIRVVAVGDAGHVLVSVSDEGVGLSAELLPRLFRKFSRINGEDRARDDAGSGLGLAICKGIVEAHGGSIWAESYGPGLGSRFTFTLPALDRESIPQPAEPAPPRVLSRSGSAEQMRILAVDDDPTALRHVRDALSQAGFSTIVTGDPKEVSRLTAEVQPHLVLLDLMLPGTDGMALMKEILENHEVPVIFLSAYDQEDVVAKALDMGASDYVVKPFSPTELAARIRVALRKHASLHQSEPTDHTFSLEDLQIVYAERRVMVSGTPVKLTATEYALLHQLSVNAGRVLTHTQLLLQVWGHDRLREHSLVRNVVKRLRSRLGDDAQNPTYIFTVPRIGYRMPMGTTTPSWE